jgi:hypothetical protein
MKAKLALLGLVTFGAVSLTSTSAGAMPNGLPRVDGASNIEQVRWVCNPWGHCFWRPNYYRHYGYRPYGFYPGPRFGSGPRGWGHRGWHRW